MRDVINHPDVLHLFSSQHWVASVDQLLRVPVSSRTVERARRAGTLTTVLPGIVRVTGSPESFVSQAMALQLYVGAEAFVSGVSAGVLHGLRNMPRNPIELTVREDRRVTMPAWGRLSRTSWIEEPRDVQLRNDGLRVATPLRMLFRLARSFNEHRFERAAEDAWHRGLVTPQAAAEYLAAIRRSGKAGVLRYEKWLMKTAVRPRPAQSGLELDVLDALRRAGLPEPVRQHPLTLRSGEMIHIDLAWPAIRLGVEPGHSWWHGGDLGQRADQARDRGCDEIGWRIIRCDESVRDDLAAFGLQLRVIYDERRRSLMTA